MANLNIDNPLGPLLLDIANAIREKKSTTDPIFPNDYADEILSIPTDSVNYVKEILTKYSTNRVSVANLIDNKSGNADNGNLSSYSNYVSNVAWSEPTTYDYHSKITFTKDCTLYVINQQGGTSNKIYINNVVQPFDTDLNIHSGDIVDFNTKTYSPNTVLYYAILKDYNGEIVEQKDIEHILYAKESGANDSVHVAQMNNTTYGKYSDYLSYSSSTRKYTVLKDCALFFIPIVRNYNASSSYPKGEFWYNDARVASYEAGNSSGATAKKTYHKKCNVGDTFYCRTSDSTGWPEQRLHVYLMPNDQISQKFEEINNTNS